MKVCGLYEGKDGFYVSRWIKGLKDRRNLEEGKASELRLGKMERVVFALPARAVFLRTITLPLSDSGKIRRALSFEMAEELAGEVSDYLFSFYYVSKERRASKVVGGVGKRETIESEVKRLGIKRVEVTSSSVAFLNALLERESLSEEVLYCFKGENEGIILLTKGKEITFERSVPPGKLAEEAELSRRLLGDKVREIRFYEDPIMIARGAALGVLEPDRFAHLNLFEERSDWTRLFKESERELRRLSIVLVLLLSLWGLSWAMEYRSTMRELMKINLSIEETYRRYFGEGKVVNPVLQAKRKVEELESNIRKRRSSGVSVLPVLERISESIPASLEVRLNGIHIMVNGVEIEGSAKSFEDVNSLRSALERSFKGVEVSYARLSADGKSVSFGMSIKEMI